MRVPFSWLKEFVDIPDNAETLAEKLTRVGVPVAEVEIQSPGISSIFSGKILELKPHPNADRLRIAQVDLKKEKIQIVTGAPNVKTGDIIPVVIVGGTVAGGKKIIESKLRGESSYGMMCSANELGISLAALPKEQQEGVLVLDPKTPIGIDLSGELLLNEPVLVIEPFANRPDYLSIFGIAREAAAIYGSTLKPPKLFEESKTPLDAVQVKIEDRACKRYIARMIDNIKIQPSPLSAALRLTAAGIRPINHVVDMTNIVMLELGQPLHAFDYNRLTGKTILARLARPGESMTAIDGKTYALKNGMLVIGDEKRALAIAGVMGGKATEISGDTTAVLLEAANFEAGSIRRTSLSLGLRTDSSRRFEKNLDPLGADWGSRRAAYLLAETGGSVHPGVSDIHEKLPEKKEIRVRYSFMKSLLGLPGLQSAQTEKIFKGLGFEVKAADGEAVVKAPIFRTDIAEETDCIEEIARHYGYDAIPVGMPRALTVPASIEASEKFEEKLRDELRALGLKETITYSLGDPGYYRKFSPGSLNLIENPLTEDRKALRPLLYPGMLPALKRNLNVKNTDLAFFEIGKVFESAKEKRSLAVIVTGRLNGQPGSVLSLKGIIEKLWSAFHIEESAVLKEEKRANFHPLRFASIENLGFLGELHPEFLNSNGIDVPVFVFELSLDKLQELSKEARFKPLPQFPESRRDISLIVDERTAAGGLVEKVRTIGDSLVESVNIFDLYRGPQIPEKKKSLTLAITYRASDRTLTEDEITKLHEKIKKELESTFNATLRIG